jgi:hypothetical protein
MTTTVDLLNAICAHLKDFELPAISSVHAAALISGPQVTVQLAGHQPLEIARALLVWADTLTEVTAGAWRVPRGDSVQLSVTGRLLGGVAVEVYGGMPFTQHGISADLAADTITAIPLAILRHLTTLGEVNT